MTTPQATDTSQRATASVRLGIACLVSVGLCLLYAATRSQLPPWWRDHGGGVPYVLFWILLWLTLIRRRSALLPVCIACVLLTCGLEFFQLWTGPTWLEDFRRTRFGAAWSGYGFDFSDLPPYFLGGIAGWVCGRTLLPESASVTSS